MYFLFSHRITYLEFREKLCQSLFVQLVVLLAPVCWAMAWEMFNPAYYVDVRGRVEKKSHIEVFLCLEEFFL